MTMYGRLWNIWNGNLHLFFCKSQKNTNRNHKETDEPIATLLPVKLFLFDFIYLKWI